MASKLTIVPQPNIVYLKIDRPKVGALDMTSKDSAMEYAEVLAVGKEVKGIEVGNHVFVKSWAIDIIDYKEDKYYFCNIETGGILAVLR